MRWCVCVWGGGLWMFVWREERELLEERDGQPSVPTAETILVERDHTHKTDDEDSQRDVSSERERLAVRARKHKSVLSSSVALSQTRFPCGGAIFVNNKVVLRGCSRRSA